MPESEANQAAAQFRENYLRKMAQNLAEVKRTLGGSSPATIREAEQIVVREVVALKVRVVSSN